MMEKVEGIVGYKSILKKIITQLGMQLELMMHQF